MGLVSDAMQSAGDIMRRLRKIEADIRSLQTARRLESASIGAGGVTVRGGTIQVVDGDIVVRDSEGRVRVRVAPSAGGGQIATYYPSGRAQMLAGTISVDGVETGEGFLVQQDTDDHFDIFNAFRNTLTGKYQFRAFDHDGNLAVDTDRDGVGLDHPYLNIPMSSTSSLGTFDHDADTEGIVFHGALRITHPYVRVIVRAWCGAATTGIIRVGIFDALGAPVQLGSDINVSSTTADFYDFGSLQLPAEALANPYGFRRLMVTAERTSGTGLVIVQPYLTEKRGTP